MDDAEREALEAKERMDIVKKLAYSCEDARIIALAFMAPERIKLLL